MKRNVVVVADKHKRTQENEAGKRQTALLLHYYIWVMGSFAVLLFPFQVSMHVQSKLLYEIVFVLTHTHNHNKKHKNNVIKSTCVWVIYVSHAIYLLFLKKNTFFLPWNVYMRRHLYLCLNTFNKNLWKL